VPGHIAEHPINAIGALLLWDLARSAPLSIAALAGIRRASEPAAAENA